MGPPSGAVAVPQPRFVWLRRRDSVAQAVSFAKAVQTGHWHDWDPPVHEAPTFRYEEVDALIRELEELERSWAQWFVGHGKNDDWSTRYRLMRSRA